MKLLAWLWYYTNSILLNPVQIIIRSFFKFILTDETLMNAVTSKSFLGLFRVSFFIFLVIFVNKYLNIILFTGTVEKLVH